MDEVVRWAVAGVVLAMILGGLAWLAARARRRGVGHEIMGPVDMIYRPHTYEVVRELRVQQERVVELPRSGGLGSPDRG